MRTKMTARKFSEWLESKRHADDYNRQFIETHTVPEIFDRFLDGETNELSDDDMVLACKKIIADEDFMLFLEDHYHRSRSSLITVVTIMRMNGEDI